MKLKKIFIFVFMSTYIDFIIHAGRDPLSVAYNYYFETYFNARYINYTWKKNIKHYDNDNYINLNMYKSVL